MCQTFVKDFMPSNAFSIFGKLSVKLYLDAVVPKEGAI